MDKISFLNIYSNWIFVWFVLFLFNIIKYNPFLLLVIAYIITLFEIVYLLINNINKYNLIKFIIINIIIKIIPILILILLKKNKYNNGDIIFTLLLTIIYFIYLAIMNINIIDIYLYLSDSYLKNNHEKTFISKYYDIIYNNIYI